MPSPNRASVAFPYPHAGAIIKLEWQDASSDVTAPDKWDDGTATIKKLDPIPSLQIQLRFQLSIDLASLAGSLPSGADPLEEIGVQVLVDGAGSQAARQRTSVTASLSSNEGTEARYTATWSEDANRIAGNLRFRPCVTRLSAGPDDHLAAFPGEEIASSGSSLELVVAEDQRHAGSDVDITWIDFATEREKDHGKAWVLDVPPDGGNPRIYMDQGIEGFYHLIQNEQPASAGFTPKQRDLLQTTITGEVWAALVIGLLQAEATEGHDGDDWKGRLLAEAADLYSEHADGESRTGEDALEQLVDDFDESPLETLADLNAVSQLRGNFHLRPTLEAVTRTALEE